MEFQLSYLKILKNEAVKCCIKYVSKFGKLSSGHSAGKGQFPFQLKQKAIPNNVQPIMPLCSSHLLAR